MFGDKLDGKSGARRAGPLVPPWDSPPAAAQAPAGDQRAGDNRRPGENRRAADEYWPAGDYWPASDTARRRIGRC
jgi:hypothetical protein